MSNEPSLQELLFPEGKCFGCGPANPHGLRLRSFNKDNHVSADWQPSEYHCGWPGIMCGGVMSTLLDCHALITAVTAVMNRDGTTEMPIILAKDFSMRFHRPTPTELPLHLEGKVVSFEGKGPTVEATLFSAGQLCATFEGRFVIRRKHAA